jgi:hypothetical protein
MVAIQKKYATDFYNPNLFVKIGLFIFTSIAVSAALGFYSLFCFTAINGLEYSDAFPIFTCLFFAILCIGGLELFIRNKLIYRSGVDEALLYSALGFILAGIAFGIDEDSNNGMLVTSILFLPFLIVASIRYIDTIASIFTWYASTPFSFCFYLN